MRSRLEIVSKLVEDKHITFEEGLLLMEEVKHPLNNFPRHNGIKDGLSIKSNIMNENFCSNKKYETSI